MIMLYALGKKGGGWWVGGGGSPRIAQLGGENPRISTVTRVYHRSSGRTESIQLIGTLNLGKS